MRGSGMLREYGKSAGESRKVEGIQVSCNPSHEGKKNKIHMACDCCKRCIGAV